SALALEATRRGDTAFLLIPGFGAKNPREPWPDKLHADHFLAFRQAVAHVHDFPLRFEVLLAPPNTCCSLDGNSNLQVRSDGHIEPGAKRGAAAAQVFAGSVFFKGKSARVAATHAQGQAHRNSTLGPLPGYALDDWAHLKLSPHRRCLPQRSVPRSR